MDEEMQSEVTARLEAISPAIAAQVRADASGAPTRTAANLLSSDANVISNAAKHTFGLQQPFGELTPKVARRLQRGGKQDDGRGPSDGLGAPFVQCILEEASREKRLYLAKLADQAERFDEMADHMAAVCKFSNELCRGA
jgi:hypothetical protein